MKKKIFGKKLSRAFKSRKALYRSLIRSLSIYGKIVTTKAKAKSVQGLIDRCINLAKEESVPKIRKLLSILGNDRGVVKALVSITKSNFDKRKSGYTRIIKLPARTGDSAEMVRLEWVEELVTKNKGVSDKSKKKVKKEIRNKSKTKAKSK